MYFTEMLYSSVLVPMLSFLTFPQTIAAWLDVQMERCVRIRYTWYYHQRGVVMLVVFLSCSNIAMCRDFCTIVLVFSCLAADFISHSMSREQLKFIFCDLLPDLSGKTVLDIGSRLGPVLYAVRACGSARRPPIFLPTQKWITHAEVTFTLWGFCTQHGGQNSWSTAACQ